MNATPETVFAILADPTTHAAIDRTGNVRASIDQVRITEAGQLFRMAMYHAGHPDQHYTIANLVEVFDEPRAIAWKPGTESPETGEVSYGGWVWRYDLEAVGPAHTKVTLTYDWSGLTPQARAVQTFPPFGVDYLEQSLQHLAEHATA